MSALQGPRQGLVLLVLVAACGEADPPALTVGPVAYSEDQLLGLTPARREALVGLTALGLAVADSTTAELGESQISAWAEERLLDILAAELTLEKNGVTDEVLQARYLLDPDWELSVRHVLVFSERWRSEAHRDAARTKAARALGMLERGMPFPEVEAALAFDEGSETREGTLPAGREGAWVPEFWAAASALEPGGLSPVTETQYGFHVLRLEGRGQVPFAEARSAVVREVAAGIEDPHAVLEAWTRSRGPDVEARHAAALAEVGARGLAVSGSDRAELLRRWETEVLSWTAALSFTYGRSSDEVAQAALAALARSGQLASIARSELTAHAAMLHARYPVASGTP